jgi:hypothetical protein
MGCDMLGIFYYMWTSVSLNVLVKGIQVKKNVQLNYFYAVCIMGRNYACQQEQIYCFSCGSKSLLIGNLFLISYLKSQ